MGRLVKIRILDYVDHCYSNDDGLVINKLIKNEIIRGNQVVVSFDRIKALNSSFVNSAFIELLDDFDFNVIKYSLKFTDSTKQINEMIKSRFGFEVNRRKNLMLI